MRIEVTIDVEKTKRGFIYTVRELPGVYAMGDTKAEAFEGINKAINEGLDFLSNIDNLELKCKECGHPYKTHYATYGTQEYGCTGPDPDNIQPNDDDYCAEGCEGFVKP